MKLTPETVRTAMLAAQGLLSPPVGQVKKDDLLPVIQRMGYLQIDTIHAVRRSHLLVLWSRLGYFDPEWVYQIQAEGHLFEYYARSKQKVICLSITPMHCATFLLRITLFTGV